MRVFICRRDEALTQQARQVLAQSGKHRIVGCIAARNADLSQMVTCGADVFVMDCLMPYADGLTLAHALAPRPCVLIAPQNLYAVAPNIQWISSLDSLMDALEECMTRELPIQLRSAIAEELTHLGFKPQTLGARQLRQALEIVLQDDGALSDVRERIYCPIAARGGCTPASVERNIRYAIESAWTGGDLKALQERFGYTIHAEKGKPTNRAFLAQLSEHIRLHRA